MHSRGNPARQFLNVKLHVTQLKYIVLFEDISSEQLFGPFYKQVFNQNAISIDIMQNFIAIMVPDMGWEKNEISIEFELWRKKIKSIMDP